MSLHTPLCDLLNIKYPILLAGMGGVAFAELCAAVSNAGGFGTLGHGRAVIGRIEGRNSQGPRPD